MRVLIVTPYFKPAWGFGGPVRSVWNLARGLHCAGAEVDVATTDADPFGRTAVPEYRLEEGIAIHTFPRIFRTIPRIDTYYYSSLLGAFLEKRIPAVDIVSIQALYTWPTYRASRLCVQFGVPFLITLRGSLGNWGLRQKVLKKKVYLELIEKKTVCLASALHYTVSAEYDEAPLWAKEIPHFIEPNGVEFGPVLEGNRWRDKFKIPKDVFLIGMVGRIHPKKGIDVLLGAVSTLSELDRPRVVIVGGGESHDMRFLRKEVDRLGLSREVTITGHVGGGDVSEALAAIDLLVLPSREENFGNVVTEALAQNTRVAVSPHVGLSRWVLEKNVGDVIPLETEAWATYLLGLPKQRPSKSRFLRPVAESYYDYRTVGSRMFEAYAKIVAFSRKSDRRLQFR